ncbi:MAG TPA: hypothetical protein VLF79_01365 [Candidatus Saccharimonadales bacterium]|nr:hypothetical protein [Candidatus Saccharimonadales bacterium]
METIINTIVSTEISGRSLPHPDVTSGGSFIPTVLGIAFGVAGALALLMITISGLRYIVAAGDPQKISKAKNGIVYSLVGLTIAIAAESIVFFVGSRVG